MKKIFLIVFIITSSILISQETIKSKPLKLKYTLPAAWVAEEFGDKANWETSGNSLCRCAGVKFSKQNKEGKMNVLIYPSTQSGLDSTKRNFVGNLRFENVEKYDKTKNKFFSFERKKSNFTDIISNKKSFDVIRYLAKVDDHYYIFYAWQESITLMSPQIEKELFEMINAVEAM